MNDNTFTPEESEARRTQTMNETDRKCPQCGGTMDFDPATGGLFCPYCEYREEIAVENKEAPAVLEADLNSAEATANCNWGADKKTVICKSCGAESIYDALQIASECPYCGSNQVMEASAANVMAPGGVCTFKIDIATAGERFRKWIKSKWFCPRKAKQSVTPQSFKGVYMPYWTFDADTHSEFKARYGIDRRVRDKDGNTRTVTDWTRVSGSYDQSIDDQPVIATNQYDTSMLRSIEPFDTADNLLYKPEYIAGFAAERYSVGLHDAWETGKGYIHSRLSREISDYIEKLYNADHVDSLKFETFYSSIKYKYLLLPIWLSSFRYNNKVYRFVVNGQTGKTGGKAPVSPLRVAIAVAIGLVLLALILWIVSQDGGNVSFG